MADQTQHQLNHNRFRAAKACRRCNQKRIRCDALDRGIPCTQCSQIGGVECLLRPSRRGTYVRKKMAKESRSSQRSCAAPPEGSPRPETSSIQHPKTHPHNDHVALDTSLHLQDDDAENEEESAVNELPTPNRTDLASLHTLLQTQPDPLAESNVSANQTAVESASPASRSTDASAASYREISWTAMFDHFLENRRQRKNLIDKCSITYLGEAFPLKLVLDEFKDGGKPRLHHPGPPCPTGDPRAEEFDHEHPSHMPTEDMAFLEAKGAFSCPDSEILDALIETFLDRFFPIYPIVNRQEFLQQWKTKKIPWILLQSLCFVAATFCPLSTLHRAGFDGRREARFSFYKRAKALFDTGYEMNKIVVLQTCILMTFWGGGPNNYWNFYSWISTAVTIAETLGIHRTMATTNMKPQDRSLLKRLWWTLIIRDASCSALVGRPFRIDTLQCDIEMLSPEDFSDAVGSPEFAEHPLRETLGLYQIQMSRLSLILRDIVTARFYPQRPPTETSHLHDMLVRWRAQLPPSLAWSDDSMAGLTVFSSCLSVLYNHHLILSHLGQSAPCCACQLTGLDSSAQSDDISQIAAQRISSLACAIVTKSNVLLMPHELPHGVFLAEVVFYTQTRSSQRLIAQLGRTALNNCQLFLHESRESWDPSPWVMQLFESLCLTAKDDRLGQAKNLEPDPVGLQGSSDLMTDSMNMLLEPDGTMSGYDPWQSHPMLSTLFEMPLDPSVGMQNTPGNFQIFQ